MMRWSDISRDTAHADRPAVVVNVPNQAYLLNDLETRLTAGQGFSLATLNLDHVVKLHNMPDFHDAYLRHSHVTADGNPIVWLSRLSGHEVSLIPGSELIEPVVQIAARNDLPIALFGSTEASLAAAAQALVARYPGLNVAAQIAPPMGFDPAGPDADALIVQLGASGARLCFVALGAPKQELFAARAAAQLPGVGFLSIGAGLDFISGNQIRAPKIVRRLAAEWLWRLASNPGRLAARYGACIAIMPRLTQAALRARWQDKERQAG